MSQLHKLHSTPATAVSCQMKNLNAATPNATRRDRRGCCTFRQTRDKETKAGSFFFCVETMTHNEKMDVKAECNQSMKLEINPNEACSPTAGDSWPFQAERAFVRPSRLFTDSLAAQKLQKGVSIRIQDGQALLANEAWPLINPSHRQEPLTPFSLSFCLHFLLGFSQCIIHSLCGCLFAARHKRPRFSLSASMLRA